MLSLKFYMCNMEFMLQHEIIYSRNVGSSHLDKLPKSLQDQKRKEKKTENTAKQYTTEQEPKDLRGLTICLHPRESAAPHHHIDHEITSSIQVAASFDLSWFLF